MRRWGPRQEAPPCRESRHHRESMIYPGAFALVPQSARIWPITSQYAEQARQTTTQAFSLSPVKSPDVGYGVGWEGSLLSKSFIMKCRRELACPYLYQNLGY